jgi:serine/threonine protein kinase
MSPGMKFRIRTGQFAFPDREWSIVSDEAKSLISGMLETEPSRRLTISDIMKSNWISVLNFYFIKVYELNTQSYLMIQKRQSFQNAEVDTPLTSLSKMKEDKHLLPFIHHHMSEALNEMRQSFDSDNTELEELVLGANSLYQRRKMKKSSEFIEIRPNDEKKPTE